MYCRDSGRTVSTYSTSTRLSFVKTEHMIPRYKRPEARNVWRTVRNVGGGRQYYFVVSRRSFPTTFNGGSLSASVYAPTRPPTCWRHNDPFILN